MPTTQLSPRYGNPVKTTTYDAPNPDVVEATSYHSWADAQVKSVTTDPGSGHLALTTR